VKLTELLVNKSLLFQLQIIKRISILIMLILLLNNKAISQNLKLELFHVSKSLKGASKTIIKPSEINNNSNNHIILNDSSILKRFIVYSFKSYNHYNLKICIGVFENSFKVVADVNGNGNFIDDSVWILNQTSQQLLVFPEFYFSEKFKLPSNQFAIVPVNKSGEIIFNSSDVDLENIYFGIITYKCLTTNLYHISTDTFKIYFKKSFNIKKNDNLNESFDGYNNFFITKKTGNGIEQLFEFGLLQDLSEARIERSIDSLDFSIVKLNERDRSLIVNLRNRKVSSKDNTFKKLSAVSISSGKKENIVSSDKLTLLFFSGSWCKGCYEIKSHIDSFENNNSDKYHFVSLLCEKSLSIAKRFAKKSKYFNNVFYEYIGNESNSSIQIILNIRVFPSLVILNSHGEILFRETGTNLIDKLLKFLN